MFQFLTSLFDTSGFPARWQCGVWSAGHGWLHIASDIATWGAYTAIPLVIGYFVIRRRDVPFPRVFWIFAGFIFFCGSVHLVEAAIFWWPAYRLSGVLKLGTALVSWGAVFAMVRTVPVALTYPGLAKVNAELEQANRDLEDFAHVASHDLKAPVRGMASLAGWVLEDNKDLSSESREHLQLISDRAKQMEDLIDGILNYSRTGRDGRELEPVDSDRTIDEAIQSVSVPEHIHVSKEGTFPTVVSDSTMLYQIFQNLLSNAVKYMDKEEGRITISCRQGKDAWTFMVRDNGRGIEEKDFDRIFDAFQSVRPVPGADATGVGLAIVKKAVNSLGGTIWLESTVGEGTCFNFTVPKRPMPAYMIAQAPAPA